MTQNQNGSVMFRSFGKKAKNKNFTPGPGPDKEGGLALSHGRGLLSKGASQQGWLAKPSQAKVSAQKQATKNLLQR